MSTIKLTQYIAHRGASLLAAENSLDALEFAMKKGLSVEVDVRLTSDSIPVLFHDNDLVRFVNDSARVDELTLHELKEFDNNNSVTTLSDAISLLKNYSLPFNIEIKSSSKRVKETSKVLVDFFLNGPEIIHQRILFSSFAQPVLNCLKKHAPILHRALNSEVFNSSTIQAAQSLGCEAIHLPKSLATAQNILAMRHANLDSRFFTTNIIEEGASILEKGASGVFTDDINLMR